MKSDEHSPIMTSLLDVDFYKFTMLQVIFLLFREIPVRFGLTCRTKNISLPDTISEKDLRRELDAARELRFDNSELHYLRGTNEYGERMFQEDFLQFLKSFKLPEYDLEYRGGKINLEFRGLWCDTSLWETIALSIVNELHYRTLMRQRSKFKQDAVYAEGQIRLAKKLEQIKEYPSLVFSEFGTRRRFSKAWQDYVVQTLKNEIPESQLRGTSNVYLAMKYGLLPMGTNAHELSMVLAGIMGITDEGLESSQHHLIEIWLKQYGEGLSIILPDTFGSEFVFRTMATHIAQIIKGFRHDSGDPIIFGERAIRFFEEKGVDPSNKMIVFSDGLDVGTMIKILNHFEGRINVSFGWGTNLTNDLGFPALSLVIKALEALGRLLVKLSDNLEKALGTKEDIERHVRVFGYTNTQRQETVY